MDAKGNVADGLEHRGGVMPYQPPQLFFATRRDKNQQKHSAAIGVMTAKTKPLIFGISTGLENQIETKGSRLKTHGSKSQYAQGRKIQGCKDVTQGVIASERPAASYVSVLSHLELCGLPLWERKPFSLGGIRVQGEPATTLNCGALNTRPLFYLNKPACSCI